MSYVTIFNPDGTMRTVKARHNQDGTLYACINDDEDTDIFENLDFYDEKNNGKNRKKKKKSIATIPNTRKNEPIQRRSSKLGETIISISQVDEVINGWKKKRIVPSNKEIGEVKSRILTDEMKNYFMRRIQILLPRNINRGICSRTDIDNLIRSWKNSKGINIEKAIRKAKGRINSDVLIQYLDDKMKEFHNENRNPVIKNSKKKKHQDVNNSVVLDDNQNEASSHGNDFIQYKTYGKKPKYGYARDFYGRIQERDHYVENRKVNEYSSNSSLYDKEDDHDSTYDCDFNMD